MKELFRTYRSSILLLASMFIGRMIRFFWRPRASILQPVADTFLNLLYCCVVPLIFCSLSAAIAKMTDLSK
ncbi:cation:dicarboxylate symporter family transporter, partial [Streptococcus pyogenes]